MRGAVGGSLSLCAWLVLTGSAGAAEPSIADTAASDTAPLFVKNVPLPRIRPAGAPPAVMPMSREELCQTLAESASKHRISVAFFGNLIYQESSLRPRLVSRKGARGIAQFMPKTARLVGLKNPFNPHEALPASARFLRVLMYRFGNNYGLAAAAYNGGPTRVSRWLKRGGGLPRETREYVTKITGKPVEEWRRAHGFIYDRDLTRNVPCAELRVLADLQNNPASADSQRPKRFVWPMPVPHPHRVVLPVEQEPESPPERAADAATHSEVAAASAQDDLPTGSIRAGGEPPTAAVMMASAEEAGVATAPAFEPQPAPRRDGARAIKRAPLPKPHPRRAAMAQAAARSAP